MLWVESTVESSETHPSEEGLTHIRLRCGRVKLNKKEVDLSKSRLTAKFKNPYNVFQTRC